MGCRPPELELDDEARIANLGWSRLLRRGPVQRGVGPAHRSMARYHLQLVVVGCQRFGVYVHRPKAHGDSSTRRWIAGLALRPGDEIHIRGSSW